MRRSGCSSCRHLATTAAARMVHGSVGEVVMVTLRGGAPICSASPLLLCVSVAQPPADDLILWRVSFVALGVQFERSPSIADAHDLCQVDRQKRRYRPSGLVLMNVTQLVRHEQNRLESVTDEHGIAKCHTPHVRPQETRLLCGGSEFRM